jgi:hypothetical protein
VQRGQCISALVHGTVLEEVAAIAFTHSDKEFDVTEI